MSNMWIIVWPVLLVALLAPVSAVFIENPPYPASPVHTIAILLTGLLAIFYTVFSGLRHSYGSLAAGSAFFFFTFVNGFLPDLWLRWPQLTLVGLGVSQAGTALVYNFVRRSPQTRLIAAMALGAIGVIPVVTAVYIPSQDLLLPVMAWLGAALIVINGVYASLKRQRATVTAIGTWLFFVVVTFALLVLSLTPFNANLEFRHTVEHGLVYGLVLLGAIFIAETLQIERQLRSGPHMDLEISFRDPLTGLANRRALETYGPRLITQSHEAGRAVSVIITDIDHFKLFNDTHGHQAGDVVLIETATKLASSVRKSDLVARYGGEEFVIVLPGSPLAPALRLAERIRAGLESETIEYNGVLLNRTASFGVATAFPEEPASLTELIHRADTNLYRAKHEGRNCVMADALPGNDF